MGTPGCKDRHTLPELARKFNQTPAGSARPSSLTISFNFKLFRLETNPPGF